jgi:sugar phosphate isomerase/epimerase
MDSQVTRRTFLAGAAAATAAGVLGRNALAAAPALPPMAIGLLIAPFGNPEARFKVLQDLGLNNCFLSLDGYIGGGFTPQVVAQYRELTNKYGITVTTVEVVGPQPLVWNFTKGPSTIGIVPREYRQKRIDALREASDFAHELGITQVQTHCGFMPEDPADPLWPETVEAIRTVCEHCKQNGQYFLMETGQETPTTMSRVIYEAKMPNLGVGLDTANLILYGKANPVDAVDILGPHIRAIHAKDGKWPTNPMELGEEVVIGKGLVNFHEVFRKLHAIGYTGAVTIERETSGPQQIEDVRQEKIYLQRVLNEVMAG